MSFSQAPKPEAKKPAPAPKAAPAGEEKAEKAAGDLIDINTATAELLKTCGNRRRVGLRLPGVAWKANIGTSQNIE